MPLFEYKAANVSGKKITGFIEASSLEEAKRNLRSSSICFLSVEQHDRKPFWKLTQKHPKIEGQALITFTEQLAGLLQAGVPLYESLLSLEESSREEKFHPVLLSLCEQIKGGTLLSIAMTHFPSSFSSLYVAILMAGEAVGKIDEALFKIAKLLIKQRKLKKQILASSAYPLLLAIFAFAILIILLTFVVPSIETVFGDNDVNRFTQLVISLSHLVREKWIVGVLGLLFLSLGGVLFFRGSYGKKFFWQTILKIPVIKTILIKTSLCRFCRTLSSLLEGGVSIVEGLRLACKVMKNPPLETVVEEAIEKVIQGSTLSSELKKNYFVPPLMVRSLAIGEESGNTKQMLNSLADLYEDELERTLVKLSSLAQPIILLILGGIVGLIMLGVLLPLTDMTSFIGES